MKVHVIRTNGTEEDHEVVPRHSIRDINRLIKASTLDTVNLRDGRVMLVDDTGLIDGKPINPEATRLYHSVCRQGTTHPICGDVAIALDKDFE